MKIDAAEAHAKWHDSKYPDVKCLAELGRLQADFYKSHREQLIDEMLAKELKPEGYKIHYYLVKAFEEAHPKAAKMCRAPGQSQS